jgi:hypothetical protein
LEDVEGVGEAGFISFQGVKVYEYSDADGRYDANWKVGLLVELGE